MSTNRLVTWIAFLAVFAMSARVSIDSDTWWHLRAGQWIVENRAVPQSDPFSYTRQGEAWQYPGWLVEVPMYWIYQLAGAGGLNLWTAVMVTLTFVFVWRSMSGGVFLRAFVLVLAAAASAVYWAARPYLVTFILAAIYMWILDDFRWRRSPVTWKRLWWLPVWMAVWANSHGGFAVGFIILGVYGVYEILAWLMGSNLEVNNARSVVHLLGVGVLCVAAVCLNPSGPQILLYPFKTVSIGALQEFIQEWQSPDFHLRTTQPFIWLLLLTLGALGISHRRMALTDFLLAGGFIYMALLAGRNMALFALAAPLVITRHAAPVLAARARQMGWRLDVGGGVGRGVVTTPLRGRFNWALLLVLALVVLLKAASAMLPDTNELEFRKTLPVDAVAFLQAERPPGQLFNSYNWGAYLLWELPEYPVFIDGRTDLYNDEIISQWLQVVRAEPGWQEVIDRWQVRLILLEPTMPVVDHLEQNGWRLLYQDERAVIYAR